MLRSAAVLLLLMGAVSCARHPRTTVEPLPPPTTGGSVADVRVSLGSTPTARVSATSRFSVTDPLTGVLLANAAPGVNWELRPAAGNAIEVVQNGVSGPVFPAGSTLRADERTGFVLLNGKRYRGVLRMHVSGGGVLLVNVLGVEEYLKGVVPLEIGNRRSDEMQAVAAQAVAARSYTVARVMNRRRDPGRLFDMVSDTGDQMYGGADAELHGVSEQVDRTAGEVLTFAGRVVEGVYSSSCGGATASAAEVWQGGGEPYLRGVSDARPGRNGYYCDIAPNYEWSVQLTHDDLAAALDDYLRSAEGGSGSVTSIVAIAPRRSANGRVAGLTLESNLGAHTVTGDRIRTILRARGSGPLRSTRFDVDVFSDAAERGVTGVTVRGAGHGHGVGMCQWGAIGRARSGESYRRILQAYYPGTRIERA